MKRRTTSSILAGFATILLTGAVLATPAGVHFTGDTTGDVAALSGTGNATAADACGYAPVPVSVYNCPGGVAGTGTGDAAACSASSSYTCAGAALSGTGDARACDTGAGAQPQCQGVAVSGAGDATGTLLAASGAGDAAACRESSQYGYGYGVACAGIAASGLGNAAACDGDYFRNTPCAGLAATLTGDASACDEDERHYYEYGGMPYSCAGVAVSAFGHASACEGTAPYCLGVAVSGCDLAGACSDGRNLTFTTLTGVTVGDDADGDGVPASVGTESSTLVIDTRDRTVAFEPAGGDTLTGDPDDANPNAPVARILSTTAPDGGVVEGPDADGDGFPAFVEITFQRVTVDTRTGNVQSEPGAGTPLRVPVDLADNEPVFPVPPGVTVLVPTDVEVGPDADGDGFPAYVQLHNARVAVDTRTGDVSLDPASATFVTLDADDADPNTPVRRVFSTVVPTGVTTGPDADGDGFPAYAQTHSQKVTVDGHAGTVAVEPQPGGARFPLDTRDQDPDFPVVSVVAASAPTGVEAGPDADGDGFPAYVRVTSTAITADRRTGDVTTAHDSAGDRVVAVDLDDANPDFPVASTFRAPVAAMPVVAEDVDGDGIPRAVTLEVTSLVVDRRTGDVGLERDASADRTVVLDGDDANPETPVASTVSAPVVLSADVGEDTDGDGFPTHVTVRGGVVTVDRRTGNVTATPNPAGDRVVRIDPDDANADSPAAMRIAVPLPVTPMVGEDADGDGVPSHVTLAATRLVVDRGEPAMTLERDAASDRVVILDADDTDPERPVVSTVSLPIVTDVEPGPDADSDGFPAYVVVRGGTLTIDRRTGEATVTPVPEGDRRVAVDLNDENPDFPVRERVTVRVASGAAPGPDADGDGAPAFVRVTFADVTADRTTGDVTVAPSGDGDVVVVIDAADDDPSRPVATRVSATAPTSVTVGPDADGDGIPAHAGVAFTRVTVDRTTGAIDAEPAGENVVAVDPNDNDARLTPLAHAALTQDAEGDFAAASGTGSASCSASTCVAVSGGGDAHACTTSLTCVAIAGMGDAAGYFAASALGDATACDLDFACTAVSGGGNAEGGDLAASALGDAESRRVALAGAGSATGDVPVSALSQCNGRACVTMTPTGDASGYWLAVTPDGASDASGAAASGSGASGGGLVAASGDGAAAGGLVGASANGDAQGGIVAASARGDADGGLLAVAPEGEAEAPVGVDA